MDTNEFQAVLSQTVPVSGCGLGVIVLLVLSLPFWLAKKPEQPDANDHALVRAHQHSANFLWLVFLLACVVVAAALAGELFGFDTLQGVAPR